MRMLSTLTFAMLAAVIQPALADRGDYEPPVVDGGRSTKMLSKLPRKLDDRVAVSIYEFRSGVTEIPARATTDMFITALVRSGQFRVVERARIAEGIDRERKLLGDPSNEIPLRAAKYLFEGTISEASPNENQRTQTISIAGMDVGGGRNRDYISIDVRVIDVTSGDIVDVVTVRKSVSSKSSSVAGVGNAIGAVLGQKGQGRIPIPDFRMENQQRESLDGALREVIDQAVMELATRLVP